LGKLLGILRGTCFLDYIVEDRDFLKLFLFVFPRLSLLLETCPVLEDLLRFFLIVPEVLLGYCAIAVFDLFLGGREVKDTLEGFPSSVPELLSGL
jgi:hypothetical protein